LKNHRELVVSELAQPWNTTCGYPPEIDAGDKKSFRNWCKSEDTNHHFLSMMEGGSPGGRVTKENPPQRCHGLIVDYDAGNFEPEEIQRALRKSADHLFKPTWLVTTFSKNYRLIWEFERPVVLGDHQMACEFLQTAFAEIQVLKRLGGYDAKSEDPSMYFELGRKWERLDGGAPIASGYVWSWAAKAAKKRRLVDSGSLLDIPLELIAAEVEKKFPGRWVGPFQLDAYGVRFWDDTADCPNGAQVRAWGMQAYSRGPHQSWADIFGKDFVAQFEADRVGPLLENTFYDADKYWCWNPSRKEYNVVNREDFAQRLRCRGFNPKKDPKKHVSEIDAVENQIKEQKLVAAALPFIHQPRGMFYYNGRYVLNTSAKTCLAPAPPGSVRDLLHGKKERFPWVYRFLQGFFDPAEQLPCFLAWLKWFYENGLIQQPKQGHALVIVGPASKGKTFLSTQFIARLVGGFSDATNFLVEGNPFSATVACEPLMCVDDSKSTADMRAHAAYSAAVKRLVANRTLYWNEKYLKGGQVEWLGRVVITCNPDPESLRIIPNIDMSNLDKICLFRTSDVLDSTLFSSPEETQAVLTQELPFFCRWLLDWQIPDYLINKKNTRFGVIPYHHKGLYEAALQQGRSYSFLEVLLDFLSNDRNVRSDQVELPFKGWSGDASQLFKEMQMLYVGHSEHIRKYDPHSISISLGTLAKRGYNIRSQIVKGITKWMVPWDLELHGPDSAEERKECANFFDVQE
jgi:hypothetical protein